MLKFIKSLCKWAFIASIFASVALFILLFFYYQDLPKLNEVEAEKSHKIVDICYSNGNRISVLGDLYANQITFNQIPAHLIDAVIATEDRRFFDHIGFDIFGILRAAFVNFKADRIVQGGSTITQQLAKMMFLSPKRNFKRKIQEVILAWQIEKTFSKEQILTFYLNRAYFGSGNYGIASASKFYFGKNVNQLNLNESAMLAGLLKAPTKFSPKNNKKLAEARAAQVIKNMVAAGYLDEDNIGEIDEEIFYEEENLQHLYFADYIGKIFTDYLTAQQQKDKNFKIITTLDENLQQNIQKQVNIFLNKHQEKLKNSQIAALMMDKNGAIVAMVGGKNYRKSQFNNALYAKRQAGSAFKTFIYLTALQNGLTPQDIFTDKEIKLSDWAPKNYDNKYYGQVSLKDAFAKSLNSVAVQLMAKIDKEKVISNAKKMGITSKINNNDATIALGTTQVSLAEMVGSYASIANGGFSLMPFAVDSIYGQNNEQLYKAEQNFSYQIIEDKNITSLKEMLRAVIANGTGKKANIGQNIYGKTGTSQNYHDAWFIGFDDKYSLGVWVGSNGKNYEKISGGSLPAELFGNIMNLVN